MNTDSAREREQRERDFRCLQRHRDGIVVPERAWAEGPEQVELEVGHTVRIDRPNPGDVLRDARRMTDSSTSPPAASSARTRHRRDHADAKRATFLPSSIRGATGMSDGNRYIIAPTSARDGNDQQAREFRDDRQSDGDADAEEVRQRSLCQQPVEVVVGNEEKGSPGGIGGYDSRMRDHVWIEAEQKERQEGSVIAEQESPEQEDVDGQRRADEDQRDAGDLQGPAAIVCRGEELLRESVFGRAAPQRLAASKVIWLPK